MVSSVMGKIFERLIENEFADNPMLCDIEGTFSKVAGKMRSQGFLYIPCRDDVENCGAYKLATERYLIKYFYNGGPLIKRDGRFLLRMPSMDADEVFHFHAFPTKNQEDAIHWLYGDKKSPATFAYYLVRTVGSLRYKETEEGELELYFDDGEESRMKWAKAQVMRAYLRDFRDPLSLPEDGVLWQEMFRQSIKTKFGYNMALTYGLRKLRRKYEVRMYATDSGVRLRGGKEGTAKWLDSVLDDCKAREWFRATMKGLVKSIDARRTQEAA